MPMFHLDHGRYVRITKEIIAKLKAKGLVEGTLKFSKVFHRERIRRGIA